MLSCLGINKEKQSYPLVNYIIKYKMLDLEKELDFIYKTTFKRLVLKFMDSNENYDWLYIVKILAYKIEIVTSIVKEIGTKLQLNWLLTLMNYNVLFIIENITYSHIKKVNGQKI